MNIDSDWYTTKLKDVCREITVGYVGPMVNEYVEDGIPFLRSQNVEPFRISTEAIKFISAEFHAKLKKTILRPGDVVVVRTGYPGTAAVVPRSILVSNCADLVILRPGADLDSWFLCSLFNSTWGKGTVAGNLVGAAQQHFNVGAAKEMIVALPPLPTQRKISAILSAYDDLIENNTRRIQILEDMARSLYREWFVHFRFPGHENTPMVESALGQIPEGWEYKRLDTQCLVVMGQSPESKHYNKEGNGLPFHQGVTNFGKHYPSHQTFCSVEGRVADDGDILFSVRAPVGRINIANTKMVLGRGLCAIRNLSGNQLLTYYQLRDRFQEYSGPICQDKFSPCLRWLACRLLAL